MVLNENDAICEVKKYLEGYEASKKLLRMMKYEKDFFGNENEDDSEDILLIPGGDEMMLKSKMYDIRRFIVSMDDGNEKTLLFYHYIRGFSVEKCSEMMNIGRTSAFRLKKKALLAAAKRMKEKQLNRRIA